MKPFSTEVWSNTKVAINNRYKIKWLTSTAIGLLCTAAAAIPAYANIRDGGNIITSISALEPSVAATHFVVSGPTSVTAGVAFDVTVTAEDNAGNTATDYAGTVHFTTTSSSFNLPANSTLTNGTGTFSVKLSTTGNQTVSATDSVTFGITGNSAPIEVTPGAASFFTISSPSTVTAGDPFDITVVAHDVFGNQATNYTGTFSFNSGDPHATLPPNSTLTNGTGTFSVALATLGNQKIDVHDVTNVGITGGTSLIAVTAGIAKIFTVDAPGNATAGTPFNFTITARNTDGNIVTGYSGTVRFTSDDPNAVLPANATLTNGTGTFSATAKAATHVTIRAKDILDPSLTGTATIAVDSTFADHMVLVAPTSATAGAAFYTTVSVRDQFNNVVKSYNGTVHFASSDPNAVLPTDLVLTQGAKQISVKLRSSGAQTITVVDAANPGLTATSAPIVVNLVAAKFVIMGPVTTATGSSATYTVTAKDIVGNTVSGYTGTVHFQTTDPTATVSTDTTLTNGTGTFMITFRTPGSQKVTAADTVNASLKGLTATTVR